MANEEVWKFKYFTMQKYNLQKNPPKRNQNPSRYHNSITNLKEEEEEEEEAMLFMKESTPQKKLMVL
jgi:hypothetical protein